MAADGGGGLVPAYHPYPPGLGGEGAAAAAAGAGAHGTLRPLMPHPQHRQQQLMFPQVQPGYYDVGGVGPAGLPPAHRPAGPDDRYLPVAPAAMYHHHPYRLPSLVAMGGDGRSYSPWAVPLSQAPSGGVAAGGGGGLTQTRRPPMAGTPVARRRRHTHHRQRRW